MWNIDNPDLLHAFFVAGSDRLTFMACLKKSGSQQIVTRNYNDVLHVWDVTNLGFDDLDTTKRQSKVFSVSAVATVDNYTIAGFNDDRLQVFDMSSAGMDIYLN